MLTENFDYKRRLAREVMIGSIPMGGMNPVRIQSMTNTPTLDTNATVGQVKRIIDAGADFVRITTPAIRDAENLGEIKKQLHLAGYKNPLVADVHFNPAVAEVAARIVEKVRINPGNYVDKKKFEQLTFTDREYQEEIERISQRISPLLKICKEYGTAIRVGVNHGSLSDRIMSRYGDSPEGMVESAMEFLRIFENEGFHQTVISMKSSNTRVMVYSTRLLIKKMQSEGMNYPVHLGVTEAGEGEDGIIKSAVGIGTLLADGIGETIRVSLTGDPEQEIPVATSIVNYFFSENKNLEFIKEIKLNDSSFEYQRRHTRSIQMLGTAHPTRVVISNNQKESIPDFSIEDIDIQDVKNNFPSEIQIFNSSSLCTPAEFRHQIAQSDNANNDLPVVLNKVYSEPELQTFQIKAACDFGPLLIDGLADAIWIGNDKLSTVEVYKTSLNLLQASRLRMSKTEYISCPSCGRTLFDLSATTAKIRTRTSHLKHLKIGIMGCIVNGPGEMADADYGYVGTGPGKITLYKSKEVVKRNIPETEAVEELIDLIKANGDWVEPVEKN